MTAQQDHTLFEILGRRDIDVWLETDPRRPRSRRSARAHRSSRLHDERRAARSLPRGAQSADRGRGCLESAARGRVRLVAPQVRVRDPRAGRPPRDLWPGPGRCCRRLRGALLQRPGRQPLVTGPRTFLVVAVTALESLVRLDAITEPGRKRCNDPLDRPERLVSELRLVLHVLAADRAASQSLGESGGRGQAREGADAAQDGLGAFGKRLVTNLEVAEGGRCRASARSRSTISPSAPPPRLRASSPRPRALAESGRRSTRVGGRATSGRRGAAPATTARGSRITCRNVASGKIASR